MSVLGRTSRSRMQYGNYSFEPVPIFSWATEIVRDSKFDEIFLRNTLDFDGIILSAGSESGQLDFILSERERLQNALASGNQEFSIFYDNIPQISGIFPRVTNVNFEEGTWTDRLNYTFQFQYDENFYGSGIQNFSENWSFEENEDRSSATVRHDLNVVGINTNTSGVNNSFENAKTFVLSKTGYNNAVANTPAFVQVSGVSFSAFEELRSEQVDPQAGAYSVSETFTLSSGNFLHTRTGQFSQGDDGITTVSIDGTIRGLGRGDIAFTRALSAFSDIKSQFPNDASGIYSQFSGESTLFTNNFSEFSVTKNEFQGTINYSVAYTDSPSENLPSGILEFNFNIQDNKPTVLFASFAIPERTLGNVVQDIGTSTEGTFTIQGNAQKKSDVSFANLLAFVEDQVNDNRPQAANYQTLRLTQHQITKDEQNNTVNFNFSWIYTSELSAAASDGPIVIV